MKVLITGASGRIGSTLAAFLKDKGYAVRGFDVVEPRAGHVQDETVTGSLLDVHALDRAVNGVDAIVHLAALMTWLPRDNPRLFEANVTGTYQLLQAAKDRNLSRFVFASSGEVYPELNPRELPITETHPTLPNSPYGMTKLLGEQMVQNIGAQHDMPYTILRFSHTQSAEELFNPNSFFSGPRFYVNAKIRQLRGMPQSDAVTQSIAALEEVASDEEQHYISLSPDGEPFRMGMCDVRDMCQGIELALRHENAVNEIFNIGARESFTFDRAVRHLAHYTGLNVVEVRLHTTRYNYETSVQKAIEKLGYNPQYDIYKMIDSVATQRG